MNEMKDIIMDEHLKSLELNDWVDYRKCKECGLNHHVDSKHKCTHYTRYLGSILDPRD